MPQPDGSRHYQVEPDTVYGRVPQAPENPPAELPDNGAGGSDESSAVPARPGATTREPLPLSVRMWTRFRAVTFKSSLKELQRRRRVQTIPYGREVSITFLVLVLRRQPLWKREHVSCSTAHTEELLSQANTRRAQ